MQNEVTFQAAGVVEVDSPRRRRTQLGGGARRKAAAWTRSGPNAPQIGFTSVAHRTVVGVLGLREWASLALDRPPSDQMDDLVIRGGRGVVASSPASSSVVPFVSPARREPVPRHRAHHCSHQPLLSPIHLTSRPWSAGRQLIWITALQVLKEGFWLSGDHARATISRNNLGSAANV